MVVPLDHISTIQFGPFLKSKETGEIKYLMASHFDLDNRPTNFESSFVPENNKNTRALLRYGDVLLTGKGQRLFAWAYDNSMGQCIPSSLFYLLRVETSKILPEYLACYLNLDKIQFLLTQIGAAATIMSIPKKELARLPIEIPTMYKQHSVVKLLNITEQDIALTGKLLEKKKLLKRALITKMIQDYEG
jgi:restriction endonuclease S subunit